MDGIPFQRPELPPTGKIRSYLQLAWDERWFSNEGPCHRLLTKRLCEYVGGDVSCLPVANATSALMLAITASVEPTPKAREVLVPSFTFIASVSAIYWSRLEPVFIDVDPDNWHPTAEGIAAAIRAREGRVAGVLACSTFGVAPPKNVQQGWEEVCADAGIPLIVDSAAGFGSVAEDGSRLGRTGDAEVFSFHATKPFGVGEGGAVFTRDRALHERMRCLSNFGLGPEKTLVDRPGFNAKMSELHAATALAVLDRFDDILQRRRTRAMQTLAGIRDTGAQSQASADGSSWQFVPVAMSSAATRERALQLGAKRKIQLRTYHSPLHAMDPLQEMARASDLPVTEDLGRRMLSLPLANDSSDAEIAAVSELVSEAEAASL